jgi:hypothetical protein
MNLKETLGFGGLDKNINDLLKEANTRLRIISGRQANIEKEIIELRTRSTKANARIMRLRATKFDLDAEAAKLRELCRVEFYGKQRREDDFTTAPD